MHVMRAGANDKVWIYLCIGPSFSMVYMLLPFTTFETHKTKKWYNDLSMTGRTASRKASDHDEHSTSSGTGHHHPDHTGA